MAKFLATISHHSISRAREIKIEGTLTAAKRAAAREFGEEQQDYEIVIYRDFGNRDCFVELVAQRRVGDRKWRS